MKKNIKKIIIILIILLVFMSTAIFTFGKYAYNSAWNYYLSSKGFYFESDLLDVNTKNNSILKWDGSNIYFNIKNSQNDELVSEYDISYKITCEVLGDESSYISCNLNDSNSPSFTGNLASTSNCVNKVDQTDVSSYSKTQCEVNGYTWNNEITSKDIYYNLVLEDATKEIDEVSVKITAESLSPYNQKIIGIFNINRVDVVDEEVILNYESYAEYDELTITNTTNTEKCMVIEFNENDYSIDFKADTVLEYETNSNNRINAIKIKIDKNSSFIYNFYKTNSNKVYSINDFIVQELEC